MHTGIIRCSSFLIDATVVTIFRTGNYSCPPLFSSSFDFSSLLSQCESSDSPSLSIAHVPCNKEEAERSDGSKWSVIRFCFVCRYNVGKQKEREKSNSVLTDSCNHFRPTGLCAARQVGRFPRLLAWPLSMQSGHP